MKEFAKNKKELNAQIETIRMYCQDTRNGIW